jgi:hypothetical protein
VLDSSCARLPCAGPPRIEARSRGGGSAVVFMVRHAGRVDPSLFGAWAWSLGRSMCGLAISGGHSSGAR